jgi:redox-sensitive bicupin YhaK (pirin superfamily)
VRAPGVQARVFLGSLLGSSSPVATHSPLLGADLTVDPGAVLRIPVYVTYEHGILVDTGPVRLNGVSLEPGQLGYVAPGQDAIELSAEHGQGARVLILGGTPLGEQIVMWWNFIGRSHDEIVEFRASWQARIGAEPGASTSRPRFDLPAGDSLPPLPAPPLPGVTLRPRPG